MFIIMLCALAASLFRVSHLLSLQFRGPARHGDLKAHRQSLVTAIFSSATRKFFSTHMPVTLCLLLLSVLVQFFLLSSVTGLKTWLDEEVLSKNGRFYEQLPVGAFVAIRHFCQISSNSIVDYSWASFILSSQGITLVLLITYAVRSIILSRLVESLRLLKLARRVNHQIAQSHMKKQR